MSKTVAIVVFAGVQSLDVTGPMDVFSEANRFLAPQDHYRLEVIGVERGMMPCSNGLSLNAHRHFSEALDAYDLLLVAGGPQLPFMDFGAAFDAWLRDACARAQRFGSICNGAFMLARAGLLEGRTVTTHWGDAAALAAVVSIDPGRSRSTVRPGRRALHLGRGHGGDRSVVVPAGPGSRAGSGAERGQAAGGVHPAFGRAIAVQPVPHAPRRTDVGGGDGAALRAGQPDRRPDHCRPGQCGQHERAQLSPGCLPRKRKSPRRNLSSGRGWMRRG